MYEKSTTERYREMLQQSVDTEVIRQAPDLDPGDEHHSVVEIQNFLKRFGYVDAVAEDRTPEPGRLDGVTVRALKEFQRTYKVGAGTGTLDAPTRELMAAPRCGMPDRLPGPSPRSIPPAAPGRSVATSRTRSIGSPTTSTRRRARAYLPSLAKCLLCRRWARPSTPGLKLVSG